MTESPTNSQHTLDNEQNQPQNTQVTHEEKQNNGKDQQLQLEEEPPQHHQTQDEVWTTPSK